MSLLNSLAKRLALKKLRGRLPLFTELPRVDIPRNPPALYARVNLIHT
jgi:hypothetical protein